MSSRVKIDFLNLDHATLAALHGLLAKRLRTIGEAYASIDPDLQDDPDIARSHKTISREIEKMMGAINSARWEK